MLGLFVAPPAWLTTGAMPPARIDHGPALLALGGLLGTPYHPPGAGGIDAQLAGGGLQFGTGWGCST